MRKLFLFALVLVSFSSLAQNKNSSLIVSGPMIGHVELRTATIWVEFASRIENAELVYRKASGKSVSRSVDFAFDPGTNIARLTLTGLEPGTTYSYAITSIKRTLATGTVTTQQLWQYRKPAPDFSFITGSCAYVNQPQYDRPGKPYGSDSIIFQAMAKEKADFMLWLGDNWYTREVDYYSDWGLLYRASHDRAQKVLQPLLKNMAHYAIWDDHDYGWNNADKSYPFKNTSREVFMKYWSNPSYGENNQGIYSKMTWNDVDVFMLDSRWFRSNDLMKDSIDGKSNPDKKMFGGAQLEWLKNALLDSKYNRNISFRIIATGSQVLNSLSPYDCLYNYPVEYEELLRFIADNEISGVVFFTGDRHHSEIIQLKRESAYPLYDVTVSSLTAGTSASRGDEKNNPDRIGAEIAEHNYSRVSFSGEKENRKMTVEFLNIRGQKISEWSVLLKDVSAKRQ